MSAKKRVKILYIQVPAGGGSLIALYEMIRQLPSTIEPVVLCYHRNAYNKMLESVARVIYLDVEVKQPFNKYVTVKIINFLLLQFYSVSNYLFQNKIIRNRLRSILVNEQPDIVHHNNEIFLNRDAIMVCKKMHLKQVVHERSLGNYGNDYANLYIDKMLMKQVHARVDITAAVAAHFNKYYGVSNSNIVLHDFVDKEKFNQVPSTTYLRTEFNLTADEKVITCIGRIISWKGQHVLVEAINILKPGIENFKVLFVGSAEDGVGSAAYKQQLEQRINELGLSKHFIFTGNRNDVPAIIKMSDVIVHCSVKPEPQGLIIIESLLSNKPVIASGDGGSGELVRKYGGYPLSSTDAGSIAKALAAILIEGNMPAVNLNRLHEDFSPEKQLAQLLPVYESCLDKKVKLN